MYRGLAPEMVPAMYTLCSRASLILPNTTEAALLLGDPMPVSYTHLDVYKRQVLRRCFGYRILIQIDQEIRFHQDLIVHAVNVGIGMVAVSYTHLPRPECVTLILS